MWITILLLPRHWGRAHRDEETKGEGLDLAIYICMMFDESLLVFRPGNNGGFTNASFRITTYTPGHHCGEESQGRAGLSGEIHLIRHDFDIENGRCSNLNPL